MAAGEGFEPSQTESESVVLPLHNPAIFVFLYADARVIILYYPSLSRDSLIKNINLRPYKERRFLILLSSANLTFLDSSRRVREGAHRGQDGR